MLQKKEEKILNLCISATIFITLRMEKTLEKDEDWESGGIDFVRDLFEIIWTMESLLCNNKS